MNQSPESNEALDCAPLRTLPGHWLAGRVNERQVHERAEELGESLFRAGPPSFPRSDPRSIAAEVLSELEILNVQLITPADVPALLEFLATNAGEEERGWQRLMNYWDGIDFDKRLHELATNPYYSKSRPPRE